MNGNKNVVTMCFSTSSEKREKLRMLAQANDMTIGALINLFISEGLKRHI